ncbi:MAG: ABC transporter substrate-binding protein [Halorubrum sp.]
MTRPIRRRELLAGVGAAAASAGCIGRVRNIAGRDRSSQLVLEIRTTPTDEDPNAIRIARALSENLNAVGIGTRMNTVGGPDLQRDVLLNHDFDIYVGQYKEVEPFDPDALYGLTHSRFTAERGWQNPFGFTELAVDALLDTQRTADDTERSTTVAELQRTLCELQPFTVVGFPDALSAVRSDRFDDWGTNRPLSPGGLLSLERVATDDSDAPTTLRLVTTDERITTNWNPIAAEYRRHGTFTSMLYDRLIETVEGDSIPWIARECTWIDTNTLRVTLRDAAWHDGEPLTASDVAFTYSFLRDTSLGSVETPVPSPQHRGRGSTVESTDVVDETTIDLRVGDANVAAARRALQVPILPEHVWQDRTETATVAGFEFDEATTEAVVSTNEPPVGSGPLRFVEATAEESVTFERNSDHFLRRLSSSPSDGDEDGETTADAETSTDSETATDGEDGAVITAAIPDAYRGKPAFDRLTIEVVGSDVAAVQMVGDGFADATASNLGPDAVPRIGREADASLVSAPSAAFYHVGYNTRRAPLSNFQFRTVVASLVDKAALVDEAFAGYARPATSPLAAIPDWVPDDLTWDDEHDQDRVHPFYGEGGDLDVERARDALREASYRFNEAGELIAQSQ